MTTMYMDCKSCGTKFEWTIVAGQDPKCARCQVLHGGNARAIVALIGEHKVPGQKDIITVLNLMLDRLDKLEANGQVDDVVPVRSRGV